MEKCTLFLFLFSLSPGQLDSFGPNCLANEPSSTKSATSATIRPPCMLCVHSSAWLDEFTWPVCVCVALLVWRRQMKPIEQPARGNLSRWAAAEAKHESCTATDNNVAHHYGDDGDSPRDSYSARLMGAVAAANWPQTTAHLEPPKRVQVGRRLPRPGGRDAFVARTKVIRKSALPAHLHSI